MPSHFSGVVTITSARATACMSGATSPVSSTTLQRTASLYSCYMQWTQQTACAVNTPSFHKYSSFHKNRVYKYQSLSRIYYFTQLNTTERNRQYCILFAKDLLNPDFPVFNAFSDQSFQRCNVHSLWHKPQWIWNQLNRLHNIQLLWGSAARYVVGLSYSTVLV